jgi:hypothetical protein
VAVGVFFALSFIASTYQMSRLITLCGLALFPGLWVSGSVLPYGVHSGIIFLILGLLLNIAFYTSLFLAFNVLFRLVRK